jgi:hypothetical protein
MNPARRSTVLIFLFAAGFLTCCWHPRPVLCDDTLDLTLDMSQQGIPLPKIFYPSIDVSGRGFHPDVTWPQTMAASAAIDCWQNDVGLRGMYRLQFNLWEISQLDKNKALQQKLLANYESIIKRISDNGGTVIFDIYGIHQGQGKVLDKASAPADLASFKQEIKEYIRYFSCVKKYSIWYEIWSAPDLDNFFLGRKNEYLDLYRAVAEAANELSAETNTLIPVGGPSTSWWFRSTDESTILTPERSLIYELIKFCSHNKLPLDFISWHGYSTDPQTEKEITGYNKGSLELIREWLSYFGFPKETPLIIDEWNFDNGLSNVIEERQSKSNVCASYLVSRLKKMYESGLDYQMFFSLEDFQENKDGVVRNVGVFWYDQSRFAYSGGSKNVYTAFRMLGSLKNNLLIQQKDGDEFSGIIATRSGSEAAVIIYNYADPEIFRSFISRNIAAIKDADRAAVLSIVQSDQAAGIINGTVEIDKLRLSGRAKNLLKKAQELAAAGEWFKNSGRQIRLTVKNLSAAYSLRRYSVDDTCLRDCPFLPVEEKEVAPAADGTSQEVVTLKPYTVTLILLKPAPPPPLLPPPPVVVPESQPVGVNAAVGGGTNATSIAPAPVEPPHAAQSAEQSPAQAEGQGRISMQSPAQAEGQGRISMQSPAQAEGQGRTSVQSETNSTNTTAIIPVNATITGTPEQAEKK